MAGGATPSRRATSSSRLASTVDPHGTRLGQGGGCYDRALRYRDVAAPVVTLLYEGEQSETDLPVERARLAGRRLRHDERPDRPHGPHRLTCDLSRLSQPEPSHLSRSGSPKPVRPTSDPCHPLCRHPLCRLCRRCRLAPALSAHSSKGVRADSELVVSDQLVVSGQLVRPGGTRVSSVCLADRTASVPKGHGNGSLAAQASIWSA